MENVVRLDEAAAVEEATEEEGEGRKVVLLDQDEEKHAVPLVVACSFGKVYNTLRERDGIDELEPLVPVPVRTRDLHFILRFQEECVCHLVPDLSAKAKLCRELKSLITQQTEEERTCLRNAADALQAVAFGTMMDFYCDRAELQDAEADEARERSEAYARERELTGKVWCNRTTRIPSIPAWCANPEGYPHAEHPCANTS